MDYQLENLGPDGFQYIAQALLTKEYQNVQCFPIGQPDGGRDATSINISSNDIIVYQVKFIKKPLAEVDAHKKLEAAVIEEIDKIKKLIPKGVKQFVLITNVPGTAHLEKGSIDRVGKILKNQIPCQSMVWWRNDINRRLDNAWDIKWAYPQILSAPDLMRGLIIDGISEHKERRAKVIKSFLVDQYLSDEEVKFKQVELQNKLLDLFIDVPVSLSYINPKRKYVANIYQRTANVIGIRDEEVGYSEPKIGAATAIMSEIVQQYFPTLVIEGAPGQGKSTIMQYIAQVYRMRLLDKSDELEKIDKNHRIGPVRLPIKIDLRDFATWLSKKHPFDFSNDARVPDKWQKSLESFIVFLIGFQSENLDFNNTDFQSIASTSSLIVLFDGLDEVADVNQRKEVVEEIVKGTKKLQELSAAVQVIVTSRPAAFANSPGMPNDVFSYFQLESLNKPLIDTYANKWIKARKLDGKEVSDIKRILRYKLGESHIRELARNPMQLAILLSLIMRRGASLPEKRTALYEQYVDLFFSRESEKSYTIREFRDIIVELHGYVAWVLHSETQSKSGTGSISIENLKTLLYNYLLREGKDVQLVDQLLNGMVERVVALVSRVEYTYEFEVQPLREFFAAKYLNDSATYSAPGREESGSKPDIFDALVRDFHWLNVARFFAGCYSKGELPSLIDRLQILSESEDYRMLNHPRLLTATLLSDWVFTQNTKSVQNAVDIISAGSGLKYFTTSQRRQSVSDNVLKLSNDNGRRELVNRCFKIVETNPPLDYAYDLIRVIISNNSFDESFERWSKSIDGIQGESLNKWLQYALRLGIISKIPFKSLISYLEDDNNLEERIRILMLAKRWDVLESTERLYEKSVDVILNAVDLNIYNPRKASHSLERFVNHVALGKFSSINGGAPNQKIESIWNRMGFTKSHASENSIPSPGYRIAHSCDSFSNLIDELSQMNIAEVAYDVRQWERICNQLQGIMANNWSVYILSMISASNRYTPSMEREYGNLFDSKKSLCKRARYAIDRSNSISWWEKTFDSVISDEDVMFSLLIFSIWAAPAVIKAQGKKFDELIQKLPTDKWHRLYKAIRNYFWIGKGFRNRLKSQEIVNSLDESVSERTVISIGIRLEQQEQSSFYEKRLLFYNGHDIHILDECQLFALISLFTQKKRASEYLSLIKRGYKNGIIAEDVRSFRSRPNDNSEYALELSVAKLIASNPDDYPPSLLLAAEQTCHEDTASRLKTVGEIARAEGWPFA